MDYYHKITGKITITKCIIKESKKKITQDGAKQTK